MTDKRDMQKNIRDEIGFFVRESRANSQPEGDLPYFDSPLVGFASIHDPLFTRYKDIIGAFHLTPRELMESDFGSGSGDKGTVICWILPITEATRAANRSEKLWPSREWAWTRDHGETFNGLLRKHLVDYLADLGHQSVAPVLSDQFRTVETPAGPSSTWSERHAAYAAGLGTFSLNDGFITERGIAHRCGSLITSLHLVTTPRRYNHHAENCLFYRQGNCGACIDRCPAGAISGNGHDRKRCYNYCYHAVVREVAAKFGVAAPGCGLCQTRIPCESGIP